MQSIATLIRFSGLCQMVLMTSKTSLQKWSGVFLFPSVSPVFFQIGTVTYQHRLCFRWRRFMYEFLPLIRKARTRCDLTGFHLAARSAQVLSLGRLACWRSSRPGARGLSARFHTLSLSRAPRLCPVAVASQCLPAGNYGWRKCIQRGCLQNTSSVSF